MPIPSLSVILPNYNYAHFFSSRLKEVLAQTYPISELIILDDASTDNSDSLIKSEIKLLKSSHPNLKIIYKRNKKNSGNVFSQWQKGISLAASDLVWIAELDDSADSAFLSTVLEPFKSNPNLVLSYTASKLIGSVSLQDSLRTAKDFVRRRHLPGAYVVSGETEVNKNLAIFNSIPNVSACVFRNLPELASILNQAKNFHLSGDWYFYLSLARLGDFAYSPKKLNLHRLSASSVTGRTNYDTRFFELEQIHRFAQENFALSPSALRRISRSESRLRTRWYVS